MAEGRRGRRSSGEARRQWPAPAWNLWSGPRGRLLPGKRWVYGPRGLPQLLLLQPNPLPIQVLEELFCDPAESVRVTMPVPPRLPDPSPARTTARARLAMQPPLVQLLRGVVNVSVAGCPGLHEPL